MCATHLQNTCRLQAGLEQAGLSWQFVNSNRQLMLQLVSPAFHPPCARNSRTALRCCYIRLSCPLPCPCPTQHRFGYTSPVGSTSEHECYPTNACPAGTELREGLEFAASVNDCVCRSGFGSPTGTGACHLCPAGTYSHGGSMEDCRWVAAGCVDVLLLCLGF